MKSNKDNPTIRAHGKAREHQRIFNRPSAEKRTRNQSMDPELSADQQKLKILLARQRLLEDELKMKSSALAEAFLRETRLIKRVEACEKRLRLKDHEVTARLYRLVSHCLVELTGAARRFGAWLARKAGRPGKLTWWILTGQFDRISCDKRARRETQLILSSGLFDKKWYKGTYPDVSAAGIDPITHFVEFGASEGRRPGPQFDTEYYVSQYPDVLRSGMNPLIHYLQIGKPEGRTPIAD